MSKPQKDGVIVKGIGGFYYVDVDGEVIEAKGKGVLKKDGFILQVGDNVALNFDDDDTPVIESVRERKNSFIRPPIANVDGIFVTMAITSPEPNFAVIDKLLVMAEKEDLDIALCINKCDLADEAKLEEVKNMYKDAYPIYVVSGENGIGIESLKLFSEGKRVAFAGASGVGKSTLINALKEEYLMETGSVSAKTNRGRHTTRHVEIFSMDNGGMIFDTPGFSSYELFDIETDMLVQYYPDVLKYAKNCKYDNCKHIKEPECMVRKAVREGELNKARYLSYKTNYIELLSKKKY